MFEALDDPTPPVAHEGDALRLWRKGRNRVKQRFAVAASTVVVAAGGGFALVHQPTPDAVVSNRTQTTTQTTSSATTVASDTTLTSAPAFGGGPLTGDSPATTDPTAPPSTPSDPSAPAPTTPPATSAPGDGDPSTPPTDPAPAPTDPEPPAPPADEVWTIASQSPTEIQSGTMPVMSVTFTVRNNTATARYVGYYSCMPAYNWFDVDSGDPSLLVINTGPGSGCTLQFMWVQPNSEETRTVSATLKLQSGPIPAGDYDLQMGIWQAGPLQLRVLP